MDVKMAPCVPLRILSLGKALAQASSVALTRFEMEAVSAAYQASSS